MPVPPSPHVVALDYLRFYDLESYVFEDVRQQFHEDGSIGAFDFFSIVVWKANRAKSRIARRLLQRDPQGRAELDPVVRDLSVGLYKAPDGEARLRILLQEWGFYLPMATAILSTLWPNEFSVYDVRVCDQLGGFHTLGSRTDFGGIWRGYAEYLDAVRRAAPEGLILRDKDRYLWGKSVAEQLQADIKVNFRRRAPSV